MLHKAKSCNCSLAGLIDWWYQWLFWCAASHNDPVWNTQREKFTSSKQKELFGNWKGPLGSYRSKIATLVWLAITVKRGGNMGNSSHFSFWFVSENTALNFPCFTLHYAPRNLDMGITYVMHVHRTCSYLRYIPQTLTMAHSACSASYQQCRILL